MEVRNRLKEIRMREFMLDPIEFADLIAVNKKTYYAWESGDATPALKECLRVANKLKKKVDDIWYLEE